MLNVRQSIFQGEKMRSTLIIIIIIMSSALALQAGDCGGCKDNSVVIQDYKFTIAGNFQALYLQKTSTDDNLGVESEFRNNRARLWLKGEIMPEKFYFVSQFDMARSAPLLDFKFIYAGLPYNTEIAFGRMKPNFTYYMPRHTGMQDMVLYPLHTKYYGMEWQMGTQTTTKISKLFKFDLGIFNGQDVKDNTGDHDKYKDFFFRGDLTELNAGPGKLTAALYGWIGGTENTVEGGMFKHNRMGLLMRYAASDWHVQGEYIDARDEEAAGLAAFDERASNSYYIQGAYKLWMEKKLEFLARYDYLDTDSDIDDNEVNWTTVGLNYYLNSYKTMLYLNYIIRDTGDNYIPLMGTYWDSADDLIIFQAQICF